MQIPIPLLRLGYRLAYLGLRIWWLIARPAVRGVKCVLVDGDSVLLVRHTYGPRGWDLPGGTVRRREQPLAAARREIAEELGVEIDDWRELGTVAGRANHRRDTLHCFEAAVRAPQLSLHQGEIAAAQWFSRADLPPKLGRYVRRVLAQAAAPGSRLT